MFSDYRRDIWGDDVAGLSGRQDMGDKTILRDTHAGATMIGLLLSAIAILALGCATVAPPPLADAFIQYPDEAELAANPDAKFIGWWEGSWSTGIDAILVIQLVQGDRA